MATIQRSFGKNVTVTKVYPDVFTLPCVITLTDPFQMMYQDVPLSPWLNTEIVAHRVAGTSVLYLHIDTYIPMLLVR